ncbi:hypothetical protein QBC39DRAFT_184746 [Podospora conica]|nr:hypothetical protein QBC39DRAFT_184746 [Schizothecium conicum]
MQDCGVNNRVSPFRGWATLVSSPPPPTKRESRLKPKAARKTPLRPQRPTGPRWKRKVRRRRGSKPQPTTATRRRHWHSPQPSPALFRSQKEKALFDLHRSRGVVIHWTPGTSSSSTNQPTNPRGACRCVVPLHQTCARTHNALPDTNTHAQYLLTLRYFAWCCTGDKVDLPLARSQRSVEGKTEGDVAYRRGSRSSSHDPMPGPFGVEAEKRTSSGKGPIKEAADPAMMVADGRPGHGTASSLFGSPVWIQPG